MGRAKSSLGPLFFRVLPWIPWLLNKSGAVGYIVAMTKPTPNLIDMIGALIGTPSVSSVDPALDQGNRGVIDLLATWLGDMGFAVEVMPLPGEPGKANLVDSKWLASRIH